jgi:hypothetical protein
MRPFGCVHVGELECGAVGPRTVTLKSLAARLAAVGGVWSDIHKHARSVRPFIRFSRRGLMVLACGLSHLRMRRSSAVIWDEASTRMP